MRDASPHHCGGLVRALRAAQRHAIDEPLHRSMRQAFDASTFRRSWYIDGKLAAVGGVIGSLTYTGVVWLALSERAMRYPIAVCKEALRQLDALAERYDTLETLVLRADSRSVEFALRLGFVPRDDSLLPDGHRARFVRMSIDLKGPLP